MTRFQDRADGGKQLAKHLLHYKNCQNALVIGLPRGGVVTAYEVAHELGLPLDLIVPRKIGAPLNPELAVGALTQEGDIIWNNSLMKSLGLHVSDLSSIIAAEKEEARRRLSLYRGNRPPLNIKDKIAILIDDGIATGATMRAAISSARKQKVKKIVVAVPVCPPDTLNEIKKEVDEVICLFSPERFFGIGAFYINFAQTTDEQVIDLMSKA